MMLFLIIMNEHRKYESFRILESRIIITDYYSLKAIDLEIFQLEGKQYSLLECNFC